MITFQIFIFYFFALNTCSSKEVELVNHRPEEGGIDEKLSALELEHNIFQMELSVVQLRYHQQEDRLRSLENHVPKIIVARPCSAPLIKITQEYFRCNNITAVTFIRLLSNTTKFWMNLIGGSDKIFNPAHFLDCKLPWIMNDRTYLADGFSNWSECDVSCGGGTQTRYRVACSDTDTDQDCKEPKVESQSCNTQSCLMSVCQPGVTYVRWGRTTCPTNGTEIVYTGYAAGSDQTHSGGVDYLCLPADPLEGPSTPTIKSKSIIYGAEYELHGVGESEALFGDQLGQHDVPCSVCRSKVRSSTLMIPGRFQCYDGWHMEYHGYLMSAYYNNVNSKTFACMDINPEKLDGGQANENGALFYPVVTRCGPLPCPPYKHDQVVPCSVCTK